MERAARPAKPRVARRVVSSAADQARTPTPPWPLPHPAGRRTACAIPLALLATTVAGFLLRLYRIDVASFWSDEVFSIIWLRSDLALLWGDGLEIETTPPLYYTLLKGWAAIFGSDETGARSLSALLSAATIPLVFLLGRELAGSRAGFLAAILFALTPVQIHYAQEARAYALLILVSCASMLALVRLLRVAEPGRPPAGALIFYASCATMLVYTHTVAPFILAALGLAYLYCLATMGAWRTALPRFLVANAVVGAVAIPQIRAMLAQAGRTDVGWIEPPSLFGLIIITDVLLVDPFTPQVTFRGACLLAALVGVALLLLLPRLRAGHRALAFLALAPAAFFALAIPVSLKFPFLIPRVVTWLSVPLCILLAILLVAPGARARRIALALSLAAAWGVGLHGVYTRTAVFKEDWRGLSASLAMHAAPSDILVVGPRTIPTGIALYADPLRATRRWQPDGTPEQRTFYLPDDVPVPKPLPTAELAQEVRSGQRVWLVMNRNDWQAHGQEALAAVPGTPPVVDERYAMLTLLAWVPDPAARGEAAPSSASVQDSPIRRRPRRLTLRLLPATSAG